MESKLCVVGHDCGSSRWKARVRDVGERVMCKGSKVRQYWQTFINNLLLYWHGCGINSLSRVFTGICPIWVYRQKIKT